MTREQGFPSVGDVHSTVPVAKEKWFEYGGERSGRFQARRLPPPPACTVWHVCALPVCDLRTRAVVSGDSMRWRYLAAGLRMWDAGGIFKKKGVHRAPQGFTNPDGSMKTECGIHVAR